MGVSTSPLTLRHYLVVFSVGAVSQGVDPVYFGRVKVSVGLIILFLKQVSVIQGYPSFGGVKALTRSSWGASRSPLTLLYWILV